MVRVMAEWATRVVRRIGAEVEESADQMSTKGRRTDESSQSLRALDSRRAYDERLMRQEDVVVGAKHGHFGS